MTEIQVNKKKKIYSFEDVDKMAADMGYTLIKDSFISYSKKFTVKDSQEYYYVMNGYNIQEDKHPRAFGKENPYTIDNIKNYIKINRIKAKLLSDVYDGNNKIMLWECECGNPFEKSWNDFLHGSVLCKDCAMHNRIKKRRIPLNEVYDKLNEMGYRLIDDISNISVSTIPFSVADSDGYLYFVTWTDLRQEKITEKFHPCNPHAIHNINNFFKIELDDEYECVDTTYVNNSAPLMFKHKKCGYEFYSSWMYMFTLKNNLELAYCKCPKCNTHKTESHHASALKQVFLYEYPDTIVEEKSCVNIITSRIMPTDIVNHKLKIAIEVQSEYHDDSDRKLKDEFKKNFWISKGYRFFDPDIRDYSILEMIQLFFPNIKKIPSYVDFNFSNCIDFNKVQDLLDDGYTIKEIADILNINEYSIRSLSRVGKIKIPKDYKTKVFNIKAIIRLSKTGEFIKKYNSLFSLKEDGLASGTIRRVLAGKQDFSYDSFWVYEDKYLSDDYVLPKIKEDKFLVSVEKYDMDNNYICSYDTIYDAENNSISSKTEIYRVAKGDRKSSRNEKWKFVQ